MKTKANLYRVSGGIAQNKNIPTVFVATILRETEKAVYLYGHGTTATTRMGKCCVCGKPLTHPVSVELGIGPECGKHWWNWDLIGGYTKENIERLKTELRNIKIDSWIPRACILEVKPSEEEVDVPESHQMVSKERGIVRDEAKPLPMRERMVSYLVNGNHELKISFPFNTIDLDRVKTLPGRTYNWNDKSWTCPMRYDSLEKLKNWGFQFCPILRKYWEIKQRALGDNVLTQDEICFLKDLEGVNGTIHDVSAQEIENIPGLKGTLMPFQKQGVAFIERKKGRAILADEMGLGKTVQALAWLQLHPELRPAIIVCPAVAKGVWKRHIQTWMTGTGTEKIQVVYGSKPEPITGDIVIINYDILPNDYIKEEGTTAKKEVPRTGWVDFLIDMNPKVVIADEVHYIKSSKANRTKGVKKLVKKVPHFLAISGTPIVNRPMEGYNAIQLVKPTMFPDFLEFGKRYCGGHHGTFGWDFSGATHTDELHDKLMDIMIRRTKKDVLKDLPEKTFSFVPLQITNRDEYDRANSELISWIAENFGVGQANRAKNAEALVRFNYLKQLTSKGKIDSVLDWIHDFLDTDGKLVVFGTYKATLDRIMKEFKDVAVRVDGDTPTSKRSEIEQRFQNDPNIRLFVGNTQAAGVALTLTASSSVAFVELPWSPGDLNQASDRCHRIGQKNAVNIYYLLAEGTIDEDIATILDEKRLVLDAVLDGKETPDEDSPTITELINKFRKGEN